MWKKYLPLLFFLLVADQILKIWVKTHMALGDEFAVFGDWFYIHFLENPGIAFGGKIEHPFWKPALTVFRLFAVVFMAWYITRLMRRGFSKGFIVCALLIWAGAVGNLIDSLFYGLIFGSSQGGQLATLFPKTGGYASLLYGQVVDMFYFPLIEIDKMPEWIPFGGGKPFVFFRPVFNLADSYITVSIISLLLFYRKVLAKL